MLKSGSWGFARARRLAFIDCTMFPFLFMDMRGGLKPTPRAG